MSISFENLLREAAPQVLGFLVRRYRDFAAAEDAVQEALLAAATQWQRGGVPDNPRAWLTQVAARRLTDEIRSNTARRRREDASAMEAGYVLPRIDLASEEDDTLVLMYMCCHPSLTTSSAIALTLRAVGGLTTAEIARAFLVPEATMAQRISRAKQTIREAGASFENACGQSSGGRTAQCLHVLYLIFNEGYTASAGDQLQRTDLAAEAIRLTRLLHAKAGPAANPELSGLLALMLLTDARRDARTGPAGEGIPLDEQDRTRWDRSLIAEGVELLTTVLKQGSVGPYQLQAAVAAVHDEASSASETDWSQIVALYDLLMRMSDNPVVRLNHAVAVSMVQGPQFGLALLQELEKEDRLRQHHRFYAVRAHQGEPGEVVLIGATGAGEICQCNKQIVGSGCSSHGLSPFFVGQRASASCHVQNLSVVSLG